LTVLRGCPNRDDILVAAAITARYSQARDMERVPVRVTDKTGVRCEAMSIAPATEECLSRVRIGPLSRSERRGLEEQDD